MCPLHSSGLPQVSLHDQQSLPIHTHTPARASFLTRTSDPHTSPHRHTQSKLSLLTHIRPPWEFFPASTETEDPIGHLHCSGHAAPPPVSSPTMPFSDFPASHHSPGPFSSVTLFGKTCLKPTSPPTESQVSLPWAPTKPSCPQHRSDHPGLDRGVGFPSIP